ncbi:hypothetical protein [Embleya sp. NPDC020630]|uniref:hypothetical protein n=1 Tax=Embleya sp. NPDC020630 TaxID=3363979 RepID=UPI003790E00A
MWCTPVPETLSWTIDSGCTALPYLDTAAANALLRQLVPNAQAPTHPLRGRRRPRLVRRRRPARPHHQPPVLTRPRLRAALHIDTTLVDFVDVVRRFPQAYQPHPAHLAADRLAAECAATARFLGRTRAWLPEITQAFGTPDRGGPTGRVQSLPTCGQAGGHAPDQRSVDASGAGDTTPRPCVRQGEKVMPTPEARRPIAGPRRR